MATVTPGPCPTTGCPPTTEVDCIVVDKVYDSCSQTVTTTQTVMVPGTCTVSSCAIDLASSTCTVGAISPSATADYSDITFVIGVDYTITCDSGSTHTETIYTTQTVTLYNPSGTTPSCTILSGTCMCVNLPTSPSSLADNHRGDATISCTFTLCLLFQTTAVVQLMIPTYGFCTPPTCPSVGPVLPCPPSPLYPPQTGTSSS